MISDAVVEEIKYRSSLEDIIASYVTLKRSGSNMSGLCPFHNEKTPSFTVFTATRSFYCFGCGAGGDVITFIMRVENLDYPSALEFLAKRAGIVIPDNPRDEEQGIKRSRVLEMNRDAARFFHSELLKNSDAQQYLSRRSLMGPIIKHFGIGYNPSDFSSLTNYMKSLGYTDNELMTGFLCGKSQKTGKLYDYFHGRIMFPIIDTAGSVVAFGGRVMDDSMPKYLNTSDTPAFKKSRNLFALNFAKNSCSEQMILCEGYMDVIALHGAGFENAVATLGTAITPDHARLMKRYTEKVIISYDSDEAGQRAADKAFRLLDEVGLEARILRVSDAKDPDEFIKKFGSERFKKLIEGSASRFEFNYDSIVKRHRLEDYEEKIKAADELCDVIAGIYSAVERDVYLRNIAEKLELPYESLKNDTERKIRRNIKSRKSDETKQIRLSTIGYGDRVNSGYSSNVAGARAEEAVLGILQRFPEFCEEVKDGKINLSADDFVTEFGRRVFEFIIKHTEDGVLTDGGINGEFSSDEVGRIIKMRALREQLTNSREVLCDCVSALQNAGAAKDSDSGSIDYISNLLKNKRQ